MGLTMVVLQGVYLASLPPGVPVSSRVDCVSRCYRQANCSSVFYDDSTKKCQLSAEVLLEGDLTSTSNNMEYFAWRRDDCDDGYTWNRSLGLCYKIYTSMKTWFQANHSCHQDGGHLIKVDSAGINELMNKISDSHGLETISVGSVCQTLDNTCPTNDADIWMGGFQNDVIGKWTWPDGSVISPAYWDDGEPGSEAEKCGGVYTEYANSLRRWHDFGCTVIHPMFVCQLPLKGDPYC